MVYVVPDSSEIEFLPAVIPLESVLCAVVRWSLAHKPTKCSSVGHPVSRLPVCLHGFVRLTKRFRLACTVTVTDFCFVALFDQLQ